VHKFLSILQHGASLQMASFATREPNAVQNQQQKLFPFAGGKPGLRFRA